MKLVIFNKSDSQVEVPVENTDGTKTSVFVQPKSKAKLSPGQSVPELFLKKNAARVNTVDLDPSSKK